MKVTDFIAKFIKAQGVDAVFELSGGMITHIIDSLNAEKDIRIITMHHEQGAAFAADGYARERNIPGIALATSGPGATNLLTGIGSCYFDSVPAVFITGQVNVHEQKGTRDIRQLGFQETDIVAMAKPITKATFEIKHESEVENAFINAFRIALSGRQGPVLIDIPMNIQRMQIEPKIIEKVFAKLPNNEIDLPINMVLNEIQKAKKPLILAGRGVRASQATNELLAFVEYTQIPIITSLLAVDSLAFNHDLRVGFIGSYGNRWANLVFAESDLLIVLGSRLDIRQTGADTNFIEQNKIIIHIDCEAGEINNRIKGCVPIIADVKQFLVAINELAKSKKFFKPQEWQNHIDELKKMWPDTNELKTDGINPNVFMHQLSEYSQKAKAFIADVGNHQMWAAQSLEIGAHQTFHTSGGMGAMGFALPAGIGMCIANNLPVVVISGDGGIQLNIQELQTIFRNNLPVKIVVINNQSLGMIRQFQDSYFDSRYHSTFWGYSAPDFVKIAEAYGLAARNIDKPGEVNEGLSWLWQNDNEPALLQVMIDVNSNAYPKIAFGKPITEMEPFAKPIEMEGT